MITPVVLSPPGPTGLVLVTAEGDAHAPLRETGAAPARAPGKGGGGIGADPTPAAEDTVTATSRAPDTSVCSTEKANTIHTVSHAK